jgi:hypothetical protein
MIATATHDMPMVLRSYTDDRQSDPHEFENLIGKIEANKELQSVVKRLANWIPKNQAGNPDLVDEKM